MILHAEVVGRLLSRLRYKMAVRNVTTLWAFGGCGELASFPFVGSRLDTKWARGRGRVAARRSGRPMSAGQPFHAMMIFDGGVCTG